MTYAVLRQPSPAGQLLWLRLTLVNRTHVRLSGETGGELLVTDPVHERLPSWIEWGGSSADFIGVRAQGTSNRPVYTVAGTKLRAHADSRVSLVGVYTDLGAGHVDCDLPAVMRAPAGLVVAHPDGSWNLDVRTGERLRVIGFKRMLNGG